MTPDPSPAVAVLRMLAAHRKRYGKDRKDAGRLITLARSPAIIAEWPALLTANIPHRINQVPTAAWLMGETPLQVNVADLIAHLGGLVHHELRSERSSPGYPDIACTIPRYRVTAWLELKTERGTATVDQLLWLASLRACGQIAEIARPSQWFDGTIEDLLRGVTVRNKAHTLREASG